MDEDSSSCSPDDDSSILRENEANQHSLSDSNANNGQILTPNSSSTNSTSIQHHHHLHQHQQPQHQNQMSMRPTDTPPVSPGYHQLGQSQRTNYLDPHGQAGLHLFNQSSSSIWSPAGVNGNFNLTPNLISAAAAAAVANINTQAVAAGSVTPSSSTSPPTLLSFGVNQSTSPSSIYHGSAFGSLNTSGNVSSSTSNSSSSSSSSSTSSSANATELQPSTTTSAATNYENYYSSSYLSPYHSYSHQTNLAHANPYRHLQASDYMSPDYNAIQRSADMWAAHKFHGF